MALPHRLVPVIVLMALTACPSSSPSSSGASSSSSSEPSPDAPPLPTVTDEATSLLFSFVDANGRMISVPSVADVPEAVRQRVLVVDLQKTPEERQAHRYAFFADLSAKGADGHYPVVVVSRYDATKGGAGAAPPAQPPKDGSVVINSAEWCGYCKKAKAWMKEHKVPYLERDVDKTPGAQAELSAKLRAAGVPGGGIPVVDWAGDVVVGFDVASFERLLKAKPPVALAGPETAPEQAP